jgi:hypothetical protein
MKLQDYSRKATLLALGCRIYTHEEAITLLPSEELEEGEWIGTDGHSISIRQLERLDERAFKQVMREFEATANQ